MERHGIWESENNTENLTLSTNIQSLLDTEQAEFQSISPNFEMFI